MRRVLIVSNTGWNLFNFRRPLARALAARGLEPVFVSPEDEYVERLRREGFRCVSMSMDRAGVNPFREALTLLRLARVYARERPVAVHHITIKCVLYGTVAAFLTGVPSVVNAVTGLGHVFIGRGWKATLVRPFVKAAYRLTLRARRVRVIFQNRDDLDVFQSLGLVDGSRVELIRGSGVDLERFRPQSLPSQPRPDGPLVLVVARLLEEKGIHEFVGAARLLRARGVEARFQVAGGPYPGNPSSIPESKLDEWRREGLVELPGHVEGIESRIAEAELVVLPSYREGVPRTLLEAAAMAKAIVATDVPGCREVVEPGVNGLLVPARDEQGLATAIERLLGDPELRRRMGEAGRAKVEREFDERLIIEATLEVYERLGVLA